MDNSKTSTFPGQFDSLAAIGDFVTNAAKAAGLDERAIYAVQMAVDEACSNIIEHAYGGEGRGTIECTYRVIPEGLTIILYDHGRPFDPTVASEPDLQCSLEKRSEGGLGLYFIRKLMDRVQFEFTSNSGNALTMTKYRKASS
jgi:anti-sigma regulatory factor (Ser/Thr protein kinase)